MNQMKWLQALSIAALLGCGNATAPNPLADFDSKRLWILVKASSPSGGIHCEGYFRAPDDPRYAPQKAQCLTWARTMTEYLQLNGLPNLALEHFEEPYYWDWHQKMLATIAACRENLGTLSPSIRGAKQREHQTALFACDPYQHAKYNLKQKHKDLGIHFPKNQPIGRYEDFPINEIPTQ